MTFFSKYGINVSSPHDNDHKLITKTMKVCSSKQHIVVYITYEGNIEQ